MRKAVVKSLVNRVKWLFTEVKPLHFTDHYKLKINLEIEFVFIVNIIYIS